MSAVSPTSASPSSAAVAGLPASARNRLSRAWCGRSARDHDRRAGDRIGQTQNFEILAPILEAIEVQMAQADRPVGGRQREVLAGEAGHRVADAAELAVLQEAKQLHLDAGG